MKTQALTSLTLVSLFLVGCNNSKTPDIKINTQPVAQSDNILTFTDTAVSSQFVAEDADGDALTFIVATQPINGFLVVTEQGNYTYTPKQEFTGEDQFTFRAFDGTTYSKNATINVTIERKQEVFSAYSRASFQQASNSQPSGVNGRDFTQDVISTDEFQDLVDNGEQ
ncbi:Ig-like domain-containing protein [Aliikangiella sp. IMCC44653]